ncbi:hypothetical protein [Candidatus Uabimicrobium amorphum]|uniref:Uncharacterized protein n=1 Tax=Uabimicrobium amorphum TaxID=2596890 RepID=A0A5S9IPT8_UABAM|nr:hypothetical protein [Candidatus Uabimicrobium amorphum]BBM85873.1 hypothetical protein UABAM_04252 [Candidatus Uabimicrobium amorphum]
MGVEKDNGNAQDEGNADGAGVNIDGADVNIELFIHEQLPVEEQQKLQKLYANDIIFQKQIDEKYQESDLQKDLEQQGCEAYDFLTENFCIDEDVVFSEKQQQGLWKKIQLRIQ